MHLDNRITIATPEGVTIELVLAGLGSRFVARLLDTLIQVIAILALVLIAAVAAGGFDLGGVVTAFVLVGAFFILFLYDIPFEVMAGGRTPGKSATGIRVVGNNGEPVDFVTSAVRNLIRIIDFLPGVYLVGSIAIVATEKGQRLGDLAAGTYVARERFGGRAPDAPVAPMSVPVSHVIDWDVTAVGAEELRIVRHFLDRRLTLPSQIRTYFAVELVKRLWPKVPGLPPDAHPEYILEGIVVAKHARA
ncbi:MAG: RDD family protein [Actinomycetota bacterium]